MTQRAMSAGDSLGIPKTYHGLFIDLVREPVYCYDSESYVSRRFIRDTQDLSWSIHRSGEGACVLL